MPDTAPARCTGECIQPAALWERNPRHAEPVEGVCPPDSTARLASCLPPSTHTPTPPQHIPSWQQEPCLPGRAACIGCCWKHIM